MKVLKLISCIAMVSCFCLGGVAGCTKPQSKEDTAKLEEAKTSAENAEKKLAELKQERMKLEAAHQSKGSDAQKGEEK